MAITKTSKTTLVSNTSTTTSPSTVATVSSKTASIEINTVETQQITTTEQISENVTKRLTPIIKEGLGKDNRTVKQDTQKLNIAQVTIQATASIQRAQKTAQETAVPISPTDAPVNKVSTILAQKTAIPSNKSNADLVRATQKNQRTCNHQFSLITKKCNLCGKDRNSHVYDV